MKPAPIPTAWDAERGGFFPLGEAARAACHERFAHRQRCALNVETTRSSRSHRHYFACVYEAWANLPASAMLQFPSSEHLRKYALIRTGFARSVTLPCPDADTARRIMRDANRLNELTIATLEGAVVTLWTPESQSERAMGARRFQQSKDAVLGWLAEACGYHPNDLGKAA